MTAQDPARRRIEKANAIDDAQRIARLIQQLSPTALDRHMDALARRASDQLALASEHWTDSARHAGHLRKAVEAAVERDRLLTAAAHRIADDFRGEGFAHRLDDGQAEYREAAG